jgi:predicted ATPase/DNA-binding SARP family transcriptional activator
VPGRLPLEPLSSLIGREREITGLVELLHARRLVTLTGPGGVGKSRLALAVAHAAPGPAWFAGLAELSDPDAVARAALDAIGAPEEPGIPPLDRLAEVLRSRPGLLLLDNCEHLADAAADVAHAVLPGTGVRLLVTSQVAMGVAGETVWPVPPLGLPDEDGDPAACAAVALFAERAAAVSPGFAVDSGNAAAVSAICRRLDGMPLALELAAARVRMLAPAQIAARLDDSLSVLVGGGRPALPRHRGVEAAIRWSHGLLGRPERELFAVLAVPAGSFDLDMVAALAPDGDHLAPLTSLVDRSLVTVRPCGEEVRYRLLQPVREYAAARLAETGAAEVVRLRHARYCVDLAVRVADGVAGPDQRRWLGVWGHERDNLQAALDACLRLGRTADALRLAAAAAEPHVLRGQYREGREWLAAALATPASGPERVPALVAVGRLAHLDCDYDRAEEALAEALATAADGPGRAAALAASGSVARERGDYAQARARHAESLRLAEVAGDRRGVVTALNYLGLNAVLAGDTGEALAQARAARAESAEVDPETAASSLIVEGAAALHHDDPATAQALLQEARQRCRDGEHREGLAWTEGLLGMLALRRGDPVAAEALFTESLRGHDALGDRWRCASALEGLAAAASDVRRRVRLLAAAAALRARLGTPVPAVERASVEATLATARADLPADLFSQLWAAGHAAPSHQVVAEALAGRPRPRPVARMRPLLAIQALGQTRVEVGGRLLTPADWTYAKPRELLYFLLGETEVSKERIGAALWPWASPARLRNSFHATLHHLRRALGDPERVVHRGGRYAFDRALPHRYDVAEREAALAAADAAEDQQEAARLLTAAVDGWGGDYLDDLPGESWIAVRRAELRGRYERALFRLAALHAEAGRDAEAAAVYERLIDHDALLESAHRELIACWARLGDRPRALRQYRELEERLRAELGVAPTAATAAALTAARPAR